MYNIINEFLRKEKKRLVVSRMVADVELTSIMIN